MKIALIAPGFSSGEEDWCIPALLDLVRVLSHGNEVHVFSLRYPHLRDAYPVYGATVHALGGATRGGVRRFSLLARAVAAILRESGRGPFDAIHGIWADEPGVAAVIAGRILRLPPVVSLAGGELEQMAAIGYGHGLSRAARAMVSFSLRGAARVTVGSRYLLERARSRAPGAPLVLLPLGVDTERFFPAPGAPSPLGEGRINLLHVGSLVQVKDQGTLLRAFKRIHEMEPRAHLHILGEGPREDVLLHGAEVMGLNESVTFHGAVNHGLLPGYYRAATLHVMSSLFESQSLAVLEAAACGVPTVGSAVGVLPEMAPDAASIAPAGDPIALADAALALLHDPAERRRLGDNALALVHSTYALSRTAPRLLALYEEVRGQGRGR